MKILATIILSLFLLSNTYSQDHSKTHKRNDKNKKEITYNGELNHFFGIKFGLSQDSAFNIMKQKGYETYMTTRNEQSIIFNNCSFAGKKVIGIALLFVDNQFYAGRVIFKPDLDINILKLYYSIQSDINTKYYETTKCAENYMWPYKTRDNNFLTAIRSGKANILSIWEFYKENKTGHTGITLKVTPSLTVELVYQDDNLLDLAIEKRKQENMQDY